MVLNIVYTLVILFCGSYGAGYVPFAVHVKDSQVNLLSSLGGGMMVGSALGMIVPEGFHAFLSEIHDHHHDDDHGHGVGEEAEEEGVGGGVEGYAGLALVVGFIVMLLLDQVHLGSSNNSCCGHQHYHEDKNASKKTHVEEGNINVVNDIDKGEGKCA